MGVDATTMVSATEKVLATLVEYFDVDFSYVRHTDPERRATVLVAEWPHRANVPDPDPLRVVYFEQADSVFRALEHATEPFLVTGSDADYQETIQRASGLPNVTSAAVPLVSRGQSTGLLGFIKVGDREWSTRELNVLKAIAALFAQLQARVVAEERLRYIALHDDLTGLANRRALLEHMEQRLSEGSPGPVAAFFLDLDRLKALNDFLGHTAGDNFIRSLSTRLRENLDPNDMIARLGGDEFVIVPAKPMDAVAAEHEAGRIQQLIGRRVTVGGESVSRAASIGVAVGIPGETTVADVLRRADHALLSAKSGGGNGVAIFTDAMRAQFELQDDVELNLRGAVSDGSLILHYQPEVDLRTGRIVAMEALVRWLHPTRGLLPPGAFVTVAEATNLAGELGRWVIRSACAQFAEWRRQGLASNVVMRINVSPVQLVSLDFVERIEDILRMFGIDGSSVCLEITEHVVVQDLARTQVTLRGLKRMGVQIAIDDFGTGYSSLSHLKALPVDAVKIDRGFVQRLGASTDDLAIVKSIIGLAGSFGLGVVGEGVETPVAARTLVGLGCYRAQGFLIARPMPAEEVEQHLAAGRIPLNLDLPRADRNLTAR
ncbi:EAL domain-containing protein [Nocardia cyriacigeorgica]|nr:bifunctional diguanylate cyclase/phosphodiesterase [Nocardia cyriacigeorgica]MBF6091339.1 EAL domain-containing protein [Nocardia cyriacigeorgica]MBF6097642.1 EAL domain-containing protein [Nocardia cyriacigeorgica]MBF6161285.1 EAL domain-containing protein [Nocardia cyriacigeorgica]MBF6200290.1 EAL domain-containing protein [Nocardia cyriacigeorgica]